MHTRFRQQQRLTGAQHAPAAIAVPLQRLTTILLLALSVVWIGAPIVAPVDLATWLMASFPFLLVVAAARALLGRGQVQAACHLIVAGLWVSLVASASVYGGLRSPAYQGMIIVVLCAGVLLHQRAAMAWALASIAIGLVLLIGEGALLLPGAPPTTLLALWFTNAVYILCASAILPLAAASVSLALGNAESELGERQEAERQLREREQQLRLALEAARMATWHWDVERDRSFWSSATTDQTLGFDASSLGTSRAEFFQRIHREDHDTVQQKLDDMLAGRASIYRFEARVILPDESIHWVEVRGRAHTDERGKIARLDGTMMNIDERKRIEEALLQSEGRLRSLLAAIPDLVLTLTYDGRYCDIFTGDESLLIHGREQVIGQNLTAVLPAETAARFLEVIQRSIDTGETQELVYQTKTLSGPRWFQARITPYVQDGERRVIWLARDISARTRAEEQLREREDIYRRAITAADAVPYYYDYKSDSYTFMGEAIEAITGYSLAELTPRKLESIEVVSIMRGAAAGLSVADAEQLALAGKLLEWRSDSLIQTRGGELRWMADSAVQVFEGGERPVGSLGILQDVTDRKRAEQRLQESEERFRMLSEAGFEGIGIVEDGWIIDANMRLSEITGYALVDLAGRSVASLVVPEDREQVLSRLASPSPQPIAHRTLRADGSTIPVESQTRQLPYNGRTLHVIAMRDISERVRLEEQLRKTQKLQAVGQLAGGLAHDFNNLLTIIMSYTSLMIEQANDEKLPEWLPRDLDQILQASRRAAGLTRQLLAFSRRQVLSLEPLDLNQTIGGVVPMLERLIGEPIELRVTLAPDLGLVRGDTGQIEQVLINLAVNARDAMPHGGRLSVETKNLHLDEAYAMRHAELVPGDYVVISVSDTGIGMDPEVQSHVFEPFFTTKDPGVGTGLGLATVHGIVKQFGGYIWFYSEPGHGTAFTICLPRVAGSLAQAPGERHTQTSSIGNETILLVEDNSAVSQMTKNILERYGYTVLVGVGEDAEQISAGYPQKIDLLLTDIVMPVVDGVELARRLSIQRPDMRVLYMSGYTDNMIVHRGVLAGSAAFLQKPFTATTLAEKIRSVLDDKRGDLPR